MSKHGNSHTNTNAHHLYCIYENDTGAILKFGITDDPLDEKGLPYRVKVQLRWANIAAGYMKFSAKILITEIPGRIEAERIEREHLEIYKQENGSLPPGNLR